MNEELLDHLELVNWIQYSSYRAANINTKTINFDGREFIELPSGKKVILKIKVCVITPPCYPRSVLTGQNPV